MAIIINDEGTHCTFQGMKGKGRIVIDSERKGGAFCRLEQIGDSFHLVIYRHQPGPMQIIAAAPYEDYEDHEKGDPQKTLNLVMSKITKS